METLKHKFLEVIPEVLDEGILYVSMERRIVIHLCVCGCGNEVVTPISPTDWELLFNGDSVSLSPSIGNWEFDCQSHYWIRNNNVHHSGKWNKKQVEAGRKKDRLNKRNHYQKSADLNQEEKPIAESNKRKSWSFRSLFKFIGL